MTTNNEKNIFDETRSEINEANEAVVNPVSKNEPVKTMTFKSSAISAAVGIAGAAAGIAGAILTTGFKEPDVTISNPDPDAPPMPEPADFNGEEVPIALGVNNDMLFDEAFTAARQEVGPGGVFAWHGHTYGTYYVNEWQGFSDEYRQAFGDYHYKIELEPYVADAPQLVESALADADAPSTEIPQREDADTADDFAPDEILVIPDDEYDVSILNIAPVEMEGDEVNVISTGIDGQDVVLVDANLDDMYDVTVVDDNGELDDISIYKIEPEVNNDEDVNNFE